MRKLFAGSAVLGSMHPGIAVVQRGLEVVDPLDRPADSHRALESLLEEVEGRDDEHAIRAELARSRPLEDAAHFAAAHRRTVAVLETLGRHGYARPETQGRFRPLAFVVPWLVQLVVRYVVVDYLRAVAKELRNLYWLREMAADEASLERNLLRAAREDADGLMTVFKRRQLGLPSFVIGGLLLPLFATGWRLAQGVATTTWWSATAATLLAIVGALAASAIVLRGAATARHRIALCADTALDDLWQTVGSCGKGPRDDSYKFAAVAITLMVCAWIVVPAVVGIAVMH